MRSPRIGLAMLACLVGGSTLGACGNDSSDGGGNGCSGTITCYIGSLNECRQYSNVSANWCTDEPGKCAEAGGTYAPKAACPTAGFVGKCTFPKNTDGSVFTDRWYTGADVATDQTECQIVNGAWSTKF